MLRQPEISITGIGAITPIGNSAISTFHQLLQGSTRVCSLQSLPAFRGVQPGYAALITGFHLSDHFAPSWVKVLKNHDPSVHYAAAAMKEALEQAGTHIPPEETALVVGTGMGGVGLHQEHHDEFLRKQSTCGPGLVPSRELASVRTVVGIIPNAAAGVLANLFDIRGESFALSTACASGANAYGAAIRMLLSGEYKRAVVVSTDQVVTPHSMAAFDVLGALASPGDDPDHMSRPYDTTRTGFLMAQGASAYVLELADAGGDPLAIHDSYAARSDGNRGSMVKSPDDGAPVYEAITGCKQFMCTPQETLWVSAHATGTPHGDIAEARGILRALEEHQGLETWWASSIKGSLGHMIGAAPGAAIAMAVLAFQQGVIPGTANLCDPDPALPEAFRARLHFKSRNAPVSGALVLASGFGGHHVAIALKRALP